MNILVNAFYYTNDYRKYISLWISLILHKIAKYYLSLSFSEHFFQSLFTYQNGSREWDIIILSPYSCIEMHFLSSTKYRHLN